MSRCILLRHGQSLFNAGETDDYDSDLSERGKYQVEEAALDVRDAMEDWERHTFVGFVSPYLRTLRTALPILKRWKVPMTVDLRVGEFPEEIKLQRYKRLPYRERDFPDYEWSDFPINGLDAEHRELEHYWNDLYSFVEDMPEDSIIISHMTTIQDLAGLIAGTGGDDHIRMLPVPNCSLTYIEDGVIEYIGRR